MTHLKRYAEELSELTHEERMQRRLSRTAVLLADIIKEEYRHRPEIVLDGEIILTVKED